MQIADLSYPFPAQVFEKELNKHGVPYKEIPKTNVDHGFSSRIYFVDAEDVEKAKNIKERIEVENAESEEKFRHPTLKILAYIVLILIAVYLTFDLLKVFK